MIKSESLAKLAPALLKAQKNMGAALKDSKNPFFKSKYADLNAIIDASIPALNDEGIAVLQSPDVIETATGHTSVINTILLHESGEFIAGQSKVVASKANDPQAEGSATTYARRYGLQAMVTLKAEDDDGESAMGRGNFAKAATPKFVMNPPAASKTGTEAPSKGEEQLQKMEADVEKLNPTVATSKKPTFNKSAVKKTEESGDLI